MVKAAIWLFPCHFWSLLTRVTGFGAARSSTEIYSSLKPNHRNQVKLVQSPDTHCRALFLESYCMTSLIDNPLSKKSMNYETQDNCFEMTSQNLSRTTERDMSRQKCKQNLKHSLMFCFSKTKWAKDNLSYSYFRRLFELYVWYPRH